MAFLDISIPILRTILNDAQCSTVSLGDGRLEELLMAAAYLNVTLIGFSTDYVVDIVNSTINPDPSQVFINFMILRAACLADQGTFRTKALLHGVEARCGSAILKTLDHITGFRVLLEEGPCKAFEEALNSYKFSGNVDIIKGILSPFASNSYIADNSSTNSMTHRDRLNI